MPETPLAPPSIAMGCGGRYVLKDACGAWLISGHATGNGKKCHGWAFPTPATHAILTVLKAGENVSDTLAFRVFQIVRTAIKSVLGTSPV